MSGSIVKTPERPSSRVTDRQALFKNRTPTGQWKERFRRGCMDRMRSKRHERMNQLRGANEADELSSSQESSQEFVSQLMIEELHHMKMESPVPTRKRFNDCKMESFDDDFNASSAEDINDILNTLGDIRQELIKEEQEMLVKYESDWNFNERSLCAAIESLSTESVICPVCSRDNLRQNKEVIFCSCGLRIDTMNDGISLDFVKNSLSDSASLHSSICNIKPSFSVMDLDGVDIQNLVMTCHTCDFMSIIL